MKNYYSLEELSCIFNISIADIFHSCLTDCLNSLYIPIDLKDIPNLRKIVFLKISDENIQYMEVCSLNSVKIFRIEASFLPIINKEEKNWPQFLNLDEKDLTKYVSTKQMKEFENYHEYMPWSYKTLIPIERVRSNITRKIDKKVTASQIFMRSNSPLVTNLFEKANSQILPHLDPNNPFCTERIKLFHNIIKRLGDPDIQALKTHTSAIATIFKENGYDYTKEDKLAQHYAYITATKKENEKHRLKKIEINSKKKSIYIKEL